MGKTDHQSKSLHSALGPGVSGVIVGVLVGPPEVVPQV